MINGKFNPPPPAPATSIHLVKCTYNSLQFVPPVCVIAIRGAKLTINLLAS
jgi:hypothetical protein